MKKILFLLSVTSLVWITACSDDDTPPPAPPGAPALTASASDVRLETGQNVEATVSLSAPAGVAQFTTTVGDESVIGVTVTGAPATGDTTATITVAIEALDIGATDITFAIKDAANEVDEVTVNVAVLAGWDYSFANPYEILKLRTEFNDMKFVLDADGQDEAYMNLAEGGIGAETFFFYGDGWLDKFIENSPFIESRETIKPGQMSLLAGMFRSQQRDNDASGAYYRNNLVWESLTSDTDQNVDLGTTANWRNVGVIGNSVFQTLVRPVAYIGEAGSAQLGTFAVDSEVATPRANELAVNVKVSLTDPVGAANGATVPYGIVHAFDGFPADIDAAFADPQVYLESVQGTTRNIRDVNIIQNLMLVDPDVKWTMNAMDPNDGTYAGSAGYYGAVIVPTTSFEDLNAIIEPIDPTNKLGETREIVCCGGGTASVWRWDSGVPHINDAVYEAAGNYWLKHWINTESVESGSLEDDTYSNALGGNISISGSTVTLGSSTVNIVKRVRYKDERVGAWIFTPEGTAPSPDYQDATDAQGFKWVEVIIVDGSL